MEPLGLHVNGRVAFTDRDTPMTQRVLPGG